MSKRKDLNQKEKKDILINYNNLPKCTQREAAIKFGISKSGLGNFLKNRDNISAEIAMNGKLSRKRKLGGKAEDIEEALLE